MATSLQVHACMHGDQKKTATGFIATLLLAFMLLVSSVAAPPPTRPSYRFDLIHVDANGGFTSEELIHRAANRSFLRAATLSATTDHSSAAVTANYSYHLYLMKLEIGTPPEPFWAVADTGSILTWTRNKMLCNPHASTTFVDHESCSQSVPGCDCSPKQRCMFTKTYGGRKKTAKGYMARDMLTLSERAAIYYGCCSDCDNILPRSADGIVGLGRGSKSLLVQLGVVKFSYCLSSQLQPQLKSTLWFGFSDDGLRLSATGAITPLVKLQALETKYYVQLHGLSIGNKHRDLSVDGFNLETTSGDKGIMLLDSGTSFSHFEKPAFEALEHLLAENGLTSAPSKNEKLTCFALEGDQRPELVLHLGAGAEMKLPWDNYMYGYDSLFCLAINKTNAGTTILGNYQQQNIEMLYDLDRGELSFVRVEDCSKL